MTAAMVCSLQSILDPEYILSPLNYTHVLGLRAAELSSLAYCDSGVLSNQHYQYAADAKYELQTVYGEDWLAFRGSSNLENWVINLDTIRTDFHGAKVHKGFYLAWNALKPAIMNKTFSKEKELLVAGHSLGGAIAQLAALDLALAGYNVTLVTLASPRVGDKAFAGLINGKVPRAYRITHSRDPVVHVPYVFMGFLHAAPEVFYHDLTNYDLCNTTTESIFCGANTLLPLPSIQEHLDYLLADISKCRLKPRTFLE